MVIGVCGFSYTGSGALIDLLREFDEIDYKYDGEFVTTYYPDGIRDLDFHLNSDFCKYASGYVSLIRFRRFIDIYLIQYGKANKQTKKEIRLLTNKFVESLSQVKWRGYGAADSVLTYGSKPIYIISSFYRRLVIKIIKKICKNIIVDFYPVHDMIMSVKPDNFIQLAKEYILSIIKLLGYSDNKLHLLDQPFSANDPRKDFPFFDNPKAIIVDRDPVDLYLYTKYYLRNTARQIPVDTVENFVNYYRQTRYGYKEIVDDRIICVHFEDLIYEYELTKKKIMEFCNISHHNNPKKFFLPEKSINNTRMELRMEGNSEELSYIKEQLKEFLFPFDSYPRPVSQGKMFD